MGYIAKEINRVIGVYHLKSHILSGQYTDDFRERIVKRYCDTNMTFIWEQFKECSHYQNSDAWSKIGDYVKENNIKNIVVATTTGGNLTYLEDEKDLHIVGVTNAYDQGQNQMREEVRKHFEEAGMDIVTAGHALSGAERCFSTYFGGYGPTEIVANTLRMFSQGVKVCVEVSTMALDAGKIPYQEKIVAIAGSGRGADTVVLLTPSYTKSILDTKVHKIIEMPE